MSVSTWKVIEGDCLEVMKSLDLGSVDAVVTDPPYGIGFKYNQHNDTPDGYGKWLWSAIEAAESKCTAGAPVFVWQAGTNSKRFVEWFPRDWRIFVAAKNFVQIRPTPMQWSYDPVLAWWKDGEPWNGGGGRDWHIADTTPQNRETIDHPCPRPLSQVKYVIESWVPPGATVLDPFCGSAGVACMMTGRNFIGIEIDPKYAAIARRRIAEAANTLWAPTEKPTPAPELFPEPAAR